MSRPHSRRRFLVLAGAAGGATALGLGAAVLGRLQPQAPEPLEGLVAEFAEAAPIGGVWLDAQDERPDREELEDQLFADLGDGARDADADALRRLVDERIRAEYERAQVRHVEDWAFALTEIRLCALAFLAGGAASTPAG